MIMYFNQYESIDTAVNNRKSLFKLRESDGGRGWK